MRTLSIQLPGSVTDVRLYRFQGIRLCDKPYGPCRTILEQRNSGARTVFTGQRSLVPVHADYVLEQERSVTHAPGLKCYQRNRLHSVRKTVEEVLFEALVAILEQ